MAEQIHIARVTGNAFAAGRFVVLVAGEPVELSPAEADELLRVRFVVKASKGKPADENGEEEDGGESVEVATAAVEPARSATAAAQHAKSRKGNAG